MSLETLFSILESKEFKTRLWVIVFLLLGLLLSNPWKFVFLLLSGITSGLYLYYGCYNDIIWKPNSEEELSKLPHYRAHQMWIHIFCSSFGSIALYYLTTFVNLDNLGQTLETYGFNLFILSFVIVMGYIGLLPRLMWFTSYGLGQLGKPFGK